MRPANGPEAKVTYEPMSASEYAKCGAGADADAEAEAEVGACAGVETEAEVGVACV